jgi:WD40 repeat protein
VVKFVGREERCQDWGEVPSISGFSGRTVELSQLQQWIIKDKCQLVALLGMGGIGKTVLSAKFAKEEKDNFEYLIWRNLRNAPPIKEELAILIRFLSDEREINLPETIGSRVTLLIKYLRERRCLVILDNAEIIMQGGDRAGYYREGYEDYGQLLRRVGEELHQSCLMLTSREKPRELAPLEGATSPVRTISLTGLGEAEGQEILKDKGLFGAEQDWVKLVENYSGNPLALKLVSEPIRELFGGDIAAFLAEGEIIFGGTRNLLDQQFERLSEIEKELMYWLAIKREAVSLEELLDSIVRTVPKRELLESLESLRRRSLIEKSAAYFTLQSVVMEYMTERLIEEVCQEITSGNISLFMSHALTKATAKDYVRAIQIRLILKPVGDRLVNIFRSQKSIESKLISILDNLRDKFTVRPGYAGGNTLNLLSQLQTDLTGYDFSHLAVWQSYLQGTNLHNVNFAYSDLSKSVFTEILDRIMSVAFSPNGKLLATGDADGQTYLWQVEDGKLLFACVGHSGWVRSVAFSPDGQTLASGSEDQTVKLWDVHNGECLKTLQGHSGRVRAVAFSPDGQTLASGSEDQTVKLWNVPDGKYLKTLQGNSSWIWSVVFSPDGQTLATSSEERVKLWDVHNGECLKTLQGHTGWVQSVVFSPDGQTLASGSSDQTVKLWDVHNGECVKTLQGHSSLIRTVAFSPDGQTLASGSEDQTVKLWDVRDGKCLKTLQGHSSIVRSVAFSADSQTLASGCEDQTMKLWNVHDGKCLKTLQGYSDRIWSVAFSPDGQTLASGSEDQTVKLWDVHNNKYLKTLQGHSGWIWSVVFSPDGQTLASGSEHKTVKLWDVHDGKCLKTLQGHSDRIWSAAFSTNGQILASGSSDQTVKLWDVHNGECLKTLRGHSSWVKSVAFSPDGQILASGSDDQTVKLWDVHNGECLKTLQAHSGRVWSVAFSPDGQTLASGSSDQTVKLWDVHNGECLKTLQGHSNYILSVAFSPDGQTLVSGSDDQTVRLWNVTDGKYLKTLQVESRVNSVAFSSDGITLASGSQDGTIRLWDMLTGKCLKTTRSPRPYEEMNITGVTGLTEAQLTTLKALGAVEDTEKK